MNLGNHNHLFDIEVLKEEEFHIKIHYVGYGSQYDEWIRRSKLCYKPRHPLGSSRHHRDD